MKFADRLKTFLIPMLLLIVWAMFTGWEPASIYSIPFFGIGMAALTKDRVTESKLVGFKSYPVGAVKIYAGSLVCLNTAGYAVPAADTVGFVIVGIADEQVDNSAGAAGDLWIKVKAPILARLDCTSITQAMLGRKVYVVDDHTVDEEFQNLTNSVLAGVLVEYISATEGWISIDPTVNMALNAPDEIVQSFSDAGAGAAGSREMLARNLTVAAAAGSATSTDPAMLGPGRFRVLGATLTKAANYIFGVIGRYGVTGAKTTTYPAGAVIGMIEDGVTEADGAIVAVLDGDTAATNAGAAFKVKSNNSIAASGFDFGVDLQDAAHDGFKAVDKDFYKKAVVRLVEDIVLHVMSGAPVDGASGTLAGIAGPGSIVLSTNGNIYSNTGTKASPTWTAR